MARAGMELIVEKIHAGKVTPDLQAATGRTDTDLKGLYLSFLQTATGNTAADIMTLERLWMMGETGLPISTDTMTLLRSLLESRGVSGAIIDMLNESAEAGTLFAEDILWVFNLLMPSMTTASQNLVRTWVNSEVLFGPDLVDTLNDGDTWATAGTNLVAAEPDGSIKITYVDHANGGNESLRAADGLNTNLVQGDYYRIIGEAKVSAGEQANVEVSQGSTVVTGDLITSTEYVPFAIAFVPDDVNPKVRTANMTGGEFWFRNLVVTSVNVFGGECLVAIPDDIPVLNGAHYDTTTQEYSFYLTDGMPISKVTPVLGVDFIDVNALVHRVNSETVNALNIRHLIASEGTDAPHLWIEYVTGGTVGASAPSISVASAGSGAIFSDGTATFKVGGIQSAEGIFSDLALTNKVLAIKANPVDDFAITVFSNAVDISVVDDMAELTKRGLHPVATSGMVYKFDNTAGPGTGYVRFPGTCGNTNVHSMSVWARVTGGNAWLTHNGAITKVAIPGASYSYVKLNDFTPGDTVQQVTIEVPAGSIVYSVFPGLYEHEKAPNNPIVGDDLYATQTRGDIIYSEPTGFEGHANFVLWSHDLDNALWQDRGSTVFTKNLTDPDGVANNAYTVSGFDDGPSVGDIYHQGSGMANSLRYEPSLWLRNTGDDFVMKFTQGSTIGGRLGKWDVDFAQIGTDWEVIDRNHPAVTVDEEWATSTIGEYSIYMARDTAGGKVTFGFGGIQQVEGTEPKLPLIESTDHAEMIITRSATGASAQDGSYVAYIVNPEVVNTEGHLGGSYNDSAHYSHIHISPTDVMVHNVGDGTDVSVSQLFTHVVDEPILILAGIDPGGDMKLSVGKVGGVMPAAATQAGTNQQEIGATIEAGSNGQGGEQFEGEIIAIANFKDWETMVGTVAAFGTADVTALL